MDISEHIAHEWFGKSIAVALSGGVDSVALLHMLVMIARAHGWESQLSAIHVNHQLHNEADAQSDFCRQLCEALSVNYQVLTVDWSEARNQQLLSDKGVESAARQCRYSLIAESVRCVGSVVATAHHQDDQVETCLLNLARGSGLSGLSAMKAHARLLVSGNDLQLWRPLLSMDKASLQSYAECHELSWVEDPTNSDITLRRNFLRREIMPRLEIEWPAFSQTASRSIQHLQDANAVIDEFAKEWLDNFAKPDVLPLSRLDGYSHQRQAWLIRAWLLSTGWSAPNTERFDEFLRQTLNRPSGIAVGELHYQDAYSGRQHRIIAELGSLWRFPEGGGISDFEKTINGRGVFGSHELTDSVYETCRHEWFIGYIDCCGLSEITHGNDQFQLKSLRHGGLMMSSKIELAEKSPACRRQLKKVLQENGVPAWMRPYLPTLWMGDQVVWIGAVGLVADSSGKSLISGCGVKIEWFCPGVSVSINPRLESLSS